MKMSKVFLLLSIVGLATAGLVGCENASNSPSPAPGPSTKSVGQFAEVRPPAITKLPVYPGGKCNMESINGQGWASIEPFPVQQKDNVSIVGWGLDDEGKRVPDSVFLRFQLGAREFYSPVETRIQRPDLVEATKQDYYKGSGYRADASLANLSPGEYQVMIIMTFPDKALLCAAGRKVKVN